jgi:D-serine deaminase-like pyridoxal phosphate-dependent protein
MIVVEPHRILDEACFLTPALAIYPEFVDANIANTIRLVGGDPKRWRPHVKTAKLEFTMRRMTRVGVTACKAATTLELKTACAAGFTDVLLAYPAVGATVRRVLEIALKTARRHRSGETRPLGCLSI